MCGHKTMPMAKWGEEKWIAEWLTSMITSDPILLLKCAGKHVDVLRENKSWVTNWFNVFPWKPGSASWN